MPPDDRFKKLRASLPAIMPSLLMCDFGHLADEIAKLEADGAPGLHLDVMDGHFVPNLTYGFPLVETTRRLSNLPIEVHLMISNPGEYVGRYIDAGADLVTIHVEAVDDARPVLDEIRRRGAAAGLALNPQTPLTAIEPALSACDSVLVMSVNAGFGGQKFEPIALDKLRELRSRALPGIVLAIDGGINESTLPKAAEAGAQMFAVGSAIFHSDNYGTAMEHLASLAHAATNAH